MAFQANILATMLIVAFPQKGRYIINRRFRLSRVYCIITFVFRYYYYITTEVCGGKTRTR